MNRQHITSSCVAACPLVFPPHSLRVCRRGGGGSQCGRLFFPFFFSFLGGAAAPTELRGRDTSTGSVQQLSFATVISVSRSTTYRDQRSPAVEPRSPNAELQTSESDQGPAGEGGRTGSGGAEEPKIWGTECNDSALSQRDLLRLLLETLNRTCYSTFLHFNLNTVGSLNRSRQ